MASTTGGVELAAAYVSLTVDGSKIGPSVRRGLSTVPGQADRVGRDSGRRLGDKMSKGIVSSVGKIAGPLAAIFATVGIGKFISGTVDEAREAQKVSAITDSIVRSTGGVAKVTAKQVGDLSTAISNKIGVDDEAIQSSANLLLTFKNVRNEVGKSNKVFDQAVGLAQDLSKAGFGSAEGAAKMLGKALNDPVKGITALGRAGVTFSEAQKKQIKDAVKNNNLLAAQKIILGEVKSQVGGVAEAAATTGEKVSVAFGNLKEKIGTALLPLLDRVGGWFLSKGLPAIERFGSKVLGIFSDMREAFSFGDEWESHSPFEKLAVVARKAWEGVKQVVTVLSDAKEAFSFGDDWESKNGIESAAVGLRHFAYYMQNEFWPALKDGWKTIQPGLERAKQIIADTFGGESGASLRDFGTLIVDKVIPGLAELANVWLPVAAKQFSLVAQAVGAAFGAVSAYLEFQVAVARRFFSVIIDGFTLVTRFAADMLDKLSVVPGFGWAKDAGVKLRGVAEKANEVKDAINGIPKERRIQIIAQVSMPGRITLPGGEKVNIGLREAGGPVRKGQPYIVGEKRPELFVPDSNGKILPRVPESAPAALGGFDSREVGDAVYDAMRGARFAVDTEDNARATARYRNTRSQW